MMFGFARERRGGVGVGAPAFEPPAGAAEGVEVPDADQPAAPAARIARTGPRSQEDSVFFTQPPRR